MQQRAALAEERRRCPAAPCRAAKVAFSPVERAHHAQAVRADDAASGRAAPRPAPARSSSTPACADLLEAGRDDDRARARRRRRTRRSTPGTVGRRRDDDRQVDRLGRRRRCVGYALIPSTLGRFGLTGIDRPAERVADQVPEERPADAARRLGRADDGDGPRREDRVERLALLAKHVVRKACGGWIRHDANLTRPRACAGSENSHRREVVTRGRRLARM